VDGAPYLFDPGTRQSRNLSLDILVRAAYFAWSPDGQKLAFYDSATGAVRVYDFATGGRETLFESNLPGPAAWAPDGQRLIFLHEDSQSGFSRVVIFEADLARQDLRPLFADVIGDDSGLPVWSPDGEELLFSQHILGGSSSRQLFLIRPDGSELTQVTDDLRFTAAAYQWSPDGRRIIFQRYAFGSSDNQPEVALWERDKNELRVLALNAAQPQWLP
jgi:Tol biopolymer transport system component